MFVIYGWTCFTRGLLDTLYMENREEGWFMLHDPELVGTQGFLFCGCNNVHRRRLEYE